MIDQPHPKLGTTLPEGIRLSERYRITKLLGSGGFGHTYLATDANLPTAANRDGSEVAVKEYFPTECGTRLADGTVGPSSLKTKGAYDKGLVDFRREAAALRELGKLRHPGIVRVSDVLDAFGTTYMVMDYISGRSLAQVLNLNEDDQPTLDTTPLPEGRVLRIMSALLDGIEKVHDKGLLHRDIKPSNVMLDSEDLPVLIDFGAVQRMGTGSGTPAVTHGYSPIEQYPRTRKNEKDSTDVYALGATAYVALIGKVPDAAPTRFLADRDPLVPTARAAREVERRLSGNVAAAVDAALSLQAGRRPQSIEEWRELLRGGWFARVRRVIRGQLMPPTGFRSRLVWAGRLLLAPALAAGVYYFWLNQRPDCGAELRATAINNAAEALRDLLLAPGACDPNHLYPSGETPLHLAAHQDSGAVAAVLLENGAVVDQTDVNGLTPLHRSAQSDSSRVATVLLAARANVQQADPRGLTPLGYAVRHDSVGVVSTLLENGADIDQTDSAGRTLLHLATERDSGRAASVLVEREAGVDRTDESGLTPLHLAAQRDSGAVASILVGAGANVRQADPDGRNPLHHAVWDNSRDVATVLLDNDANVRQADSNGWAALHLAAQRNFAGMANLLLERRADPNLRDRRGQTPLHLAARHNSGEVASLLLDRGANADETDGSLQTPLHAAAWYSAGRAAAALVRAGADVNARNDAGSTPLHYAARRNASGVARLLLDHGADPSAVDEDGRTPRQAADANGAADVVAELQEDAGLGP